MPERPAEPNRGIVLDLSGRTALVTGSTRGIGLGAAFALARAGARVVINGRERDAVDAAVARVDAVAPFMVRGVVADVGTADGCATVLEEVPDVDVLVNNVGIYAAADVLEIDDDEWLRFYQVNVMSGVRLSRAYLPRMRAADWGRVIFVSSESGLNIPVEMVHYGVTKTALLGLSRGLAKRMAGTRVTVNAVLPGMTMTEGVAAFVAGEDGTSIDNKAERFLARARPSSITRRPASVEEVANLIAYLASPLSSATTGAALRADGGIVDTIA